MIVSLLWIVDDWMSNTRRMINIQTVTTKATNSTKSASDVTVTNAAAAIIIPWWLIWKQQSFHSVLRLLGPVSLWEISISSSKLRWCSNKNCTHVLYNSSNLFHEDDNSFILTIIIPINLLQSSDNRKRSHWYNNE